MGVGTLTGNIFDLRRFSVHDGPGIRTTVFMKGCPLECQWCHNPEGKTGKIELMVRPVRCIQCGTCLITCPRGAISRPDGVAVIDREICDRCGLCVQACYAGALELVGYRMTVTELIDQLIRDQVFFDQSGGGVTFSGGEPVLQAKFLIAILEECKQMNIHTAVDTCGYAPWAAYDAVSDFTDLFLYDLKLMDSALHKKYTGVSNEIILKNLAKLSLSGKKIIVRIPVIPGVNDDDENFLRAGSFLAGLPSLEYVELLAYHTIGTEKYTGLGQKSKLLDLKPPLEDKMQDLVRLLKEFSLPVIYGGS